MSQEDFNADIVRHLAVILKETDLTEIEYEKDACKIRVARQIPSSSVLHPVPSMMNMPYVGGHHLPVQGGGAQNINVQEAAPSVPSAALPQGPIDHASHPGAIKSPMVGNGYLAPKPDADFFVKPGDLVAKGQTLLIIEAMKVMNQIKSPRDGVVKEVLVKNGEPIEYEQVLMIIE